MNYTENFHLPQWVKSDRIMMEDFNQMCADIESGFSGHAERMDHFQQDSSAQEKLTFDRLCRLAYNHLGAVAALGTMPRQIGVFHENPNRDQTTAIPGTIWRDGVRYMVKNGTAMTDDQLKNSFTTVSTMKIVRNDLSACEPQILAFSPTTPGAIQNLAVGLYYSNPTTMDSNPVPFRMEMKNLDTGETEWYKYLEIQMNLSGSAGATYLKELNIPFHGGCRYHLILRPLGANTEGRAELTPKSTYFGANFFQDAPGCTFTKSLRDVEESSGGMAVVRCRRAGENGTVTFRWNNVEMQPAMTRTYRDENGQAVLEYVYLRQETVPAENDFSLTFQCGVNSEFWFYDWGAILF